MIGPRVWAVVDLDSVRHNVRVVRARVGPGVAIAAVVKADAYGHGAVAVSRAMLDAGTDLLAVGDSGEAIELRESGVTAPILILGATVEREVDDVIHHRITPTVHSQDRVRMLDLRARRHGVRLAVHVKVDTGLGRLGVQHESAVALIREVVQSENLRLEGVSTHFAESASEDPAYTREQHRRFLEVLSLLEVEGIRPRYRHAANTAAIFGYPETHHDMVRPGAALYGLDPGCLDRHGVHLAPVLSLCSQVAYLKNVPEGASISYGRSHRTSAATRIATLPIGYNDGVPFQWQGTLEVLVRGRRAPLVGRVTMDYVMVDVGEVPGVRIGDRVTFIGRDGEESIRAEEVAARVGTIAYALTCGLGRRVRRMFHESGRTAAGGPEGAAGPAETGP
ncbi:MAG: alanine racemase [Planctomycetes bacterium]|nr:alanine racemase [Planctomycetota bacterium]